MDRSLNPAPVNMADVAATVMAAHEHRRICTVNDHVVTLAVNEVDFPWHYHPHSDEFFYVIEGRLRVEYSDGSHHMLRPNDTLVIRAGTVHRTAPQGRAVNLLVERTDTETRFLEEGQNLSYCRSSGARRPTSSALHSGNSLAHKERKS